MGIAMGTAYKTEVGELKGYFSRKWGLAWQKFRNL